ncbi:molybdopterin molybdotransferase MoeA [Eionea flava]
MLAIDDAIKQIIATITPVNDTENIHITQASGRIIAGNIYSSINVPPADNSAMDGYAINTEDLAKNTTLRISQTVNAGDTPKPLSQGTAARIFTGAEIPLGANAVVMQEHCTRIDDSVTLPRHIEPQNNIRQCGQDIQQGDCVIQQGRCLQPQDIGLIASIGVDQVSVYRPLRVAIISTGNELTEPGKPLSTGKIYNANRYLLHSFLQQMNITVVDLGDIPDSLPSTIEALQQAAHADCIISTGGVSVGDEDHIKTAVEQLGSLDFWKVAIKPGKPIAVGHIATHQKTTPFIGLPGNPASVFVTFLLFARTLLLALQHQNATLPKGQRCRANFTWQANTQRQEYLRAQRDNEGNITIHPKQNSGILSSTAWANGLAVIPPQQDIAVGDTVEFIGFEGFGNF